MPQKRSEGVVQQVIGKVRETASKVLGNRKVKTEGKREQVAAAAERAPAAAKATGPNKPGPATAGPGPRAKPAQKATSPQKAKPARRKR